MGSTPFRVIDGGLPEKPKRPKKARVLVPWECRVCDTDIGIRTRSLIKVRDQAFQDQNLKITGGIDVWACACCMARGKVTPVTA